MPGLDAALTAFRGDDALVVWELDRLNVIATTLGDEIGSERAATAIDDRGLADQIHGRVRADNWKAPAVLFVASHSGDRNKVPVMLHHEFLGLSVRCLRVIEMMNSIR